MTLRHLCSRWALAIVATGMACAAAPAAGADWRVIVDEQAQMRLECDRVTVLSAKYVFWSADWKYQRPRIQAGEPADGQTPFSGQVRGMALNVSGTVAQPDERTLVFHYKLDAQQAMSPVIGGGVEFSLDRGAAVLGDKTPDPVLLEGDRGWRWTVPAPVNDDEQNDGVDDDISGRTIEVTFDPPAARVVLQDDKAGIRAFFFHDALEAGVTSFTMTVTLPAGTQRAESAAQRYGDVDLTQWRRGALDANRWPIDLRFLNADDTPAGRHGFVHARGDQLVFDDGTVARFWGANVAAGTLFVDKIDIENHAMRIAALGYNLVRLHHHDSMSWVDPTVIDKSRSDSQTLDPNGMDRLDWWVKCLKDQGVYVWLDLHVGRQFREGDDIPGYEDLEKSGLSGKGFCYVNDRLKSLMQDFNAQYLNHVNAYTHVAYKDEPAVMGVLITNENDLTHHFGNRMLADKDVPFHQKLLEARMDEFAQRTGLSRREVGRTWAPGPGKLFLNDLEHRFNADMIAQLRGLGLRVPIATTNLFGRAPLYGLPSMTDGDVIDVHAYGKAEMLSLNPRDDATFVARLGSTQVLGKPLIATEWNVPGGIADRFTAPLYVMALASLQGWDAPMIYNYAQEPIKRFHDARDPSQWSTYHDPAITAMMPAAAIAFRRQHVRPAKETWCLQLSAEQLFAGKLNAYSSAAIRTLVEQHRLTIGLPAVKELPWLKATEIPAGVKVGHDPDQDFLPADATSVVSDTGELMRDWNRGIATIDTPRTASAEGWIGGQVIDLKHARFALSTAKAAAVVTSLDDKPIDQSERMLVTVAARAVPGARKVDPFYSEPVAGSISVRCATPGLTFIPLAGDGTRLSAVEPQTSDGVYTLTLPHKTATHWFLLTGPESE